MSKTPKLRFPEFSGEWEEERSINLFYNISDKNHNGDLEVLSSTQDRGVIPRNKLNIDIKFEESNLTSYKKVNISDFIISLRSFQGGIECSKYIGLMSPAYTIFNFKADKKQSNMFFSYIFKSKNFINRLNTLTYGIRDGKAISFKDFSSMKMVFPSLQEQQKIASFLSLVDKKIEKQSEKVEAIKEYKKGMMQKIFSREIRFKDDEGKEFPEWEEKKLKTLIYNKKKGNQPAYSDCGNILLSNEYLENKFSTVYVKNPIDVEYDDVLILWDGSQAGKCYTGVKGVLGSTFVSLTLKKDISPVYIYQYLSFKIDIIKLAWREGSGVPHVSKDFINNFKINICCIKEQKKIANFLSTIDKKLEKEEEKLEALRIWKKGLLQQMFV